MLVVLVIGLTVGGGWVGGGASLLPEFGKWDNGSSTNGTLDTDGFPDELALVNLVVSIGWETSEVLVLAQSWNIEGECWTINVGDEDLDGGKGVSQQAVGVAVEWFFAEGSGNLGGGVGSTVGFDVDEVSGFRSEVQGDEFTTVFRTVPVVVVEGDATAALLSITNPAGVFTTVEGEGDEEIEIEGLGAPFQEDLDLVGALGSWNQWDGQWEVSWVSTIVQVAWDVVGVEGLAVGVWKSGDGNVVETGSDARGNGTVVGGSENDSVGLFLEEGFVLNTVDEGLATIT